jgi:hypothetical protein
MKTKERVTCSICCRKYSGKIPKGGDGSVLFPRKHNLWKCKITCEGSLQEALEYK